MANFIGYISPENNTLIINGKGLFPDLSGNVTLTVTTEDTADFRTYVFGYKDETKDIDEPAHLFVNGVRYTDLQTGSISSSVEPYIFMLRIEPSDFVEGKLSVKLNSHNIDVYVSDDMQKVGSASMDANVINGNLETFMLMRTNPKLTGNIKLVVDSEYNLYLDTFKVSSILNNRIYRKYPVSSEGNYPFDVMTVFSSMPQSELFKLPSDALNPKKFYSDYKKQYDTTYDYGAETNTDNLYSENMKILAPLHIGKTPPDYFCVFRYSGTYNESSYENTDINDTEQFKNLLKKSDVVKIFDLRNYTSIGQYLRNYSNLIRQYLYGSCYMQFIEQDTEKYGENYRQGNNSWRGIDIAKGIITNKIETSYFANEILERDSAVQENFNDFIISGYERNNVLYPYILNIEFMFNDRQSEDFSMNRYFGLYLSQNDFIKYSAIIRDNNLDNGVMRKYDENDNIIADRDIIDKIFNKRFDDRLFFMTTNNDATRIRSYEDCKEFITKYVVNNPDKNLCNVDAEFVEWHKDEKSFITLSFSEPIRYGEHLRFISIHHRNDTDKTYDNICLEIIGSNDIRLTQTDNYISPYISTNTPVLKKYDTDENETSGFYRLAFYTQSLEDPNVLATVPEQLARIRAAISKFNSFVTVESVNEDTIGISTKHNEVYFQHILPSSEVNSLSYEVMYMTGNTLNFTGDKSRIDDSTIWPFEVNSLMKDAGLSTDNRPSFGNKSEVFDKKAYVPSSENVKNNICAEYCEFTDPVNQTVDTIRYFSKTLRTNMYPLNPRSYDYRLKYSVFSTFGYDVLGWRYSSVVKFKSMKEFGYAFMIYDDIEEILKVEKHPIVKTVNDTFESIRKIKIETGYVTDNPLVTMGVDFYTQSLKFNSYEFNTVINPYNVSKSIVGFEVEPKLYNYQMMFFNPESATVSAMGIFGIRDIDMSIDYSENIRESYLDTVKIPKGEVIHLNSQDDARIKKNTVYRMMSGSFNEFGAYKFLIAGTKVYYTVSKDAGTILEADLYNDTLVTATDVTLASDDSNVYQKYNFTYTYPEQKDENFWSGDSLFIPVVPQTNCQWESNGLYFDGFSMLSTHLMKEGYDFPGYFTEFGKSPQSHDNPNKFCLFSIDSYCDFNNQTISFREALLKHKMKNVLRKMITQNVTVDTAVGYFNSDSQTLEFIYFGLKFVIKFNSEFLNPSIRMGEYNNFDVYVINEYYPTKENEIFVSVPEELIVLVNHQFDMYGSADNYKQIKSLDTDIKGTAPYGANPAPFILKSETVTALGDMMYAYKTTNAVAPLNTDYFVEEVHSKVFEDNATAPNFFYFPYYSGIKKNVNDTGDILFCNSGTGVLFYDGSKYSVNLLNSSKVSQKELMSVSHRDEIAYTITKEREVSEVKDILDKPGSVKLDDYILSLEKNFTVYIVNENSVEALSVSGNNSALTMEVTRPNRIKYNFGYFRPSTYEIVSFNTVDQELSDVVDMSMLLANTSVKKVNRLKSFTGNKVFSGTISVQSNYFIGENKSILTSNWDRQFYRTYDNRDETKFTYLDGYVPGIEDKTFFGSRCLVLKEDYITLNDFKTTTDQSVLKVDSTHNIKAKNVTMNKFSMNVTLAIFDLFQNNETFISNWYGLTNSTTSIRNYIKNSISEIFNIQRVIEVELYTLVDDTIDEVEVIYEETDLTGWEKDKNFKSQITTNNGDIILTVTIESLRHRKVHPVVKIYRH